MTYRQPTSSYSPNLSASHKDKDKFLSLNRTAVKIKTLIRQAHGHASMSRSPVARSPKQPSFQSYVDIKESKTDEEDGILDRSEELSRRKASSGSDGSGSSLNTLREYSRTDSFTRNMRPSYHYPLQGSNLRRTGSSETVSSQSTLVQKPSFYETDDSSMGITDFLLPSESHHGGLTQSRIRAFTERSEGGRLRYDRKARGMYDYQRGRKGAFSGKQEHEEEQDPPRDDGEWLGAGDVCVCVCMLVSWDDVCVCVRACFCVCACACHLYPGMMLSGGMCVCVCRGILVSREAIL